MKEGLEDIFSGKVDAREDFLKQAKIEFSPINYQNMDIGDVSFHHGLTFHRAKTKFVCK